MRLQFYCREADLGKSRADACVQRLAELNQYVRVSVHTGAVDETVLKRFQVRGCAGTGVRLGGWHGVRDVG